MRRTDWQQLSTVRAREALSLLNAGEASGAYYLSGYVVECALKACVSRQFQQHVLPDKRIVMDSYTHDLDKLVRVAGLDQDLKKQSSQDGDFGVNWTLVKDWTEASRYEVWKLPQARDLYQAVVDQRHGVLQWLKRHW